MSYRLPAWFALLVLLAGGLPARADDPPAGEPPAGEAPEGSGLPAAPERVEVDLLGYLKQLETLLRSHEVPPLRTATDHALYDAWSAILKPRAARMVRRVREIGEARRWEADATGTGGVTLRADQWATVVGELASLYTELGGALEQYLRVKVAITQVSPGVGWDRPPPTGWVPSQYPLAALERDLLARVRAGQMVAADEVSAYWWLLHRVDQELLLRAEALRRWEERQERIREQLESMIGNIEAGLQETRQALFLEMLSVRMLAAALQAREESRLRLLVGTLPDGDVGCTTCGGLLNSMRSNRLAAQSHDRPPTHEYGTILRRWLKGQQDVLRLLAKAGKATAQPGADGTAPPADAAPGDAAPADPAPR